jgi:hypothetical protein
MVMTLPPLLEYESEAEYRDHYQRVYCRGVIFTFDGIRVYFGAQKFGHAFYESSAPGRCPKDSFSLVRANRMDWIKATLEHPDAVLYQGWDKDKRRYVPERRVSVVYEDFVVVIDLRKADGEKIKARFVTCYQADNSIEKIRCSPRWTLEECLAALNKKGR